MGACRRCGQCCTYVTVRMNNLNPDNDPQGQAQWFENHYLTVYPVPVDDDGEKTLVVRIPLVCRHLEFDTATATAFCMDYENRPQMCRDHLCPVAKGESPNGES